MTENKDKDEISVKVPTFIILKEVVTFVSLAVAITLAWGVFGTRLTVVEQELVYQAKAMEQQQKQIDILKEKQDKFETRIRDNEDAIQNLWTRKDTIKNRP